MVSPSIRMAPILYYFRHLPRNRFYIRNTQTSSRNFTRRLDSGRSDDGVTHGAEKKFHVALLYLSTGQIDLTGVPSFMNLPKDCKTIKMFKPENCNEVFLIQTGGWY